MRRCESPLDRVTVAAPCGVGWENMAGDERVRFCGQCGLNVYNLSGMTKGEAERLVARAEGTLCVRYYRRADGTILTKNCPAGLRALKRRAARVATATASAALSFFSGVLAAAGLRERPFVPVVTKSEVIEIPAAPPEAALFPVHTVTVGRMPQPRAITSKDR
jgi:hypothetical protein